MPKYKKMPNENLLWSRKSILRWPDKIRKPTTLQPRFCHFVGPT